MNNKQIVTQIENCMINAKDYADKLDYTKELLTEIELLKLKHELYILINSIIKEQQFL